ncbi:MAG: sensor domain-containing protein [Anaerolineaceae bacterium]|nr:sensor domain-containing protein [Anaerolineaceae bacterium]
MPQDQFLAKYFTIFAKPKMYLTLLYLLLSFPLGLTYFILLVVGFSLGISLLIVWVGFLILAILLPTIWMIISFEKLQTTHLLGIELPSKKVENVENQSLWQKTKSILSDPTTWKGLLFILLKFPIGIFSFVILVTGFAVLFSLIFSPFIVPWVPINFGYWQVDTISEAIGLSLLGLMALPGAFHVYYFIGQWIGKLSVLLLGQQSENEIEIISE